MKRDSMILSVVLAKLSSHAILEEASEARTRLSIITGSITVKAFMAQSWRLPAVVSIIVVIPIHLIFLVRAIFFNNIKDIVREVLGFDAISSLTGERRKSTG